MVTLATEPTASIAISAWISLPHRTQLTMAARKLSGRQHSIQHDGVTLRGECGGHLSLSSSADVSSMSPHVPSPRVSWTSLPLTGGSSWPIGGRGADRRRALHRGLDRLSRIVGTGPNLGYVDSDVLSAEPAPLMPPDPIGRLVQEMFH
jgi:hypothetical protein